MTFHSVTHFVMVNVPRNSCRYHLEIPSGSFAGITLGILLGFNLKCVVESTSKFLGLLRHFLLGIFLEFSEDYKEQLLKNSQLETHEKLQQEFLEKSHSEYLTTL